MNFMKEKQNFKNYIVVKKELINTFELVKDVVRKREGRSRAGLMLGLQELGATLNGFIGAYFPVASNIIVINKTPLRRVVETDSTLLKPYAFHILLHEYIHSLGFFDETFTTRKVYEISKNSFGDNHVITKLAKNITAFFPNLVYPVAGWLPPKEIPPIEIVQGFDSSSSNNYIT